MSEGGPDLRPLLAAGLLVGLGLLAYVLLSSDSPPPAATPAPPAVASARLSPTLATAPPPQTSPERHPSATPRSSQARPPKTPTPSPAPAARPAATQFVLTGRVVDADGPVAGARATLWLPQAGSPSAADAAQPELGIERQEEAEALARIGGAIHDLGQAETDAQGRYTITVTLPPGPLELRISAHAPGSGGAPARVAKTLVRVSEASRLKGSGDAGDLRLEKVPALRFHVTGPQGTPLQGARIVIYREVTPPGWSAPHPTPWVRVLMTDAEGRAGVDLRGARIAFSVTHPGHATDHALATLTPEGLAVEVKLDPGVSIQGRIQEPEGVPLPGALVQAYELGGPPPSEALAGSRLTVQAKSGPDGRFKLEGLGSKRDYRLVVSSSDPSLLPAHQTLPAPAEGLTLTLQRGLELLVEGACTKGRPERVGFVLQRRRESGLWEDVGLHSPQPEQPFQAHFGRLAAGTYRAALHGLGFAPVASEPLELEPEASQATIPLRLDAPPRSLSGRVLDAKGQPVPGATIQWTDFGTIYGQSDAEGRFALAGLPDGALRVVVGRAGFAPQPVDVPAGLETLPAIRLARAR